MPQTGRIGKPVPLIVNLQSGDAAISILKRRSVNAKAEIGKQNRSASVNVGVSCSISGHRRQIRGLRSHSRHVPIR